MHSNSEGQEKSDLRAEYGIVLAAAGSDCALGEFSATGRLPTAQYPIPCTETGALADAQCGRSAGLPLSTYQRAGKTGNDQDTCEQYIIGKIVPRGAATIAVGAQLNFFSIFFIPSLQRPPLGRSPFSSCRRHRHFSSPRDHEDRLDRAASQNESTVQYTPPTYIRICNLQLAICNSNTFQLMHKGFIFSIVKPLFLWTLIPAPTLLVG
ncbi:hypothetical protein F4678DRAFT_215751 [Xylaria arbuscula]|nr:hypothetical protein F4678DRAFT_215751 [Xylaria arbuscula]